MSTFNLTININNAAFDGAPGLEVARILRAAAGRIEEGHGMPGGEDPPVRDINGNTVGRYWFNIDPDEPDPDSAWDDYKSGHTDIDGNVREPDNDEPEAM